VGVSPLAYCDPRFWPIKDIFAYRNYLNGLSSFVSWLLQDGYNVVLFPTQVRMDRLAIEELKALVLEKLPPRLHARLSDRKATDRGRVFGLSFTARYGSHVSAPRRYSCFSCKYSDNCHFACEQGRQAHGSYGND